MKQKADKLTINHEFNWVFLILLGNSIALVTVHQMKFERHRTVFFVFIAGLAFADLIGQVLTTFPVLLVYSHGYYVGGVRPIFIIIGFSEQNHVRPPRSVI